MHASANAPIDNCTAPVAPPPQLDRRPWPARVRDACRAAKLKPTTRLVALTLASHFDRGGTWSMSIDQIADECGIHRRKIYEHLATLTKKGILARKSGGGAFRNLYGPGEKVCKMAPAPRATKAAAPVPVAAPPTVPVAAPVTDLAACALSQKTAGTKTAAPDRRQQRRDPRDDDRHTCSKCGHSWPRRFGGACLSCGARIASTRAVVPKTGSGINVRHTCTNCGNSWPKANGDRCHGCNGRAIEAIEAEEAAQRRHDRMQAERLQAEIANRPTQCPRCNATARTADVADTGRCPACRTLTDERAAEVRSKGERLARQLREAWQARDHVRGKALAHERAELYRTSSGGQR